MDSVTFSCVTAAPVRTPHLPCLSLFLVYRNHFNELIFMQTPGLACPVFPVCGCKGTTKNQYQPNISATFFQEFFAKIPKTSHISLLPLHFFYALQHIFPSPSLKQSHTDIIRPISHHLLHCKNKKAPTLKMSRLFLLYIKSVISALR